MRACHWWYVAALSLGLAGLAQASYFKLDLQASTQVRGGRVTAHVTMRNAGDEAMGNVAPSAWLAGQPVVTGSAQPELAVGESLARTLDLGQVPPLPGHYTAVVSVRYTDRYGHPFTTLKTMPVYTADPGALAPLAGRMEATTLDGPQLTDVTLNWNAETPVNVRMWLVLPPELTGSPREATIRIPGFGTVTQRVALARTWAVDGSQYRVFAIADFVWQGQHRSCVIPGALRVPGRSPPPARFMQALWAIPAAFLLAFALWPLGLRHVRARRAAGPPPGPSP